MSFQYTYNDKGKPVGVFIPINEWEEISIALKKKSNSNTKRKTLKSIEKGLQQVNQIEKGKLKSLSLKQLLDEL